MYLNLCFGASVMVDIGDVRGGGRGGRLEVPSHAAARGQWVSGTQPEHTWRAG